LLGAIRGRRSAHSFYVIEVARHAPSPTRRSSCINRVCISKPGKAGADRQFADGRLRVLGAQQARARPRQPVRYQHSQPLHQARQHTSDTATPHWLSMCKSWVLDFLSTCLKEVRRFIRHRLDYDGAPWHGRHHSGRELCGASRESCMEMPRQVLATTAGQVGRIAIGRRRNMLSTFPPTASLFVRPQR
jgi:hypothetical protein